MNFKKIIIICGIIFLTGCKTNYLECSKNFTDDKYGNRNQTINVTFKDDEIYNLKLNVDVSFVDGTIDSRDQIISSLQSAFSGFNDKHIKYSTKLNDNGFVFKLNVNFNKLSEEVKKNLYIINYKNSYDELKIEFESSGYLCK